MIEQPLAVKALRSSNGGFLTPRHQCDSIGAVFIVIKRVSSCSLEKKQKQPLKDAISLADQALEIAYTYLRDKRFQPTRADLALFEQLRDKLLKHHETVYFIARRLGQRFRGEAEGPKKFTDPEVFDYHYPDLDKILRSKKRVNLHAREKDDPKGACPKGS